MNQKIDNLEEKKKIIQLLTVSMCSAPITPSKNFILIQWYKRWKDFSIKNRKDMRLRMYKGHLVESTTQAKINGKNFVWKYPELDAILQDTVDDYAAKYVNMKTRRKNFAKNIEVFISDLESYRKLCEIKLNQMLGRFGR